MASRFHLVEKIRRAASVVMLAFVVAITGPAHAQDPASPTRTTAQLEQLAAPIALYPDALLSQILMASTYPLEVIAAARWSQANPGITGQALEEAMQKQTWDPSVKALTAVPQVLRMMNDKLEWTQQLGDAFLAQQSDVLAAVQRLRGRADANGQLKTTAEQKVTKTAAAPTSQPAGAPQSSGTAAAVYTIAPTDPEQYYVPIYDPGLVYGDWPYPDYAPFYWYPPGYAGGRGLSFAAGIAVGGAVWGTIDWARRSVGINPLGYNRFNRTTIAGGAWTHNPAHRGAVPYRDKGVAQRFGNPGGAAREGYRGAAESGRRDLATQHHGAGPKGAGGAKSAAAHKPAATKKGAATKTAATKKGAATKTAATKKAASTKKGSGAHQVKSKRGGGRQVAQSRGAGQRGSAGAGAAARSHAGGARTVGMGGARAGGGARGGGGRGGGRRSDIRLKHDIELVGRLDNGLGIYRFSYVGSHKIFVGVMAQEVQNVLPEAAFRGPDGYLRVYYERVGFTFQTYDHWIATGGRISPATSITH